MKTMNLWFAITILFLVIGTVTTTFSQNDPKTSLTLEPIHIAAFKNGVGIVRAKVELPDANGSYRIHPLPDSTMGTFWLNWHKDIQLTEITATQAKTTNASPASSIHELLEANIGKSLILTFNDEKYSQSFYKIIDIPVREHPGPISPQKEDVLPPPIPERGNIILIQNQAGDDNPILALPISKIESIELPINAAYELEKHNIENVIEFKSSLSGNINPDHPTVFVTYLANGIAWTPSYVIDISEEDNAVLSAKSVIMNDLLPLDEVEAELIVGFPHIQFSHKNSAFSLTPYQQIVERMEDRRVVEDFAMQNTFYAGAQVRMADAARPSMPAAPVAGTQTEDLYFYQIDSVSLKRGERGYFPLFAAEIPYEHVYTWDIPNYIDRNNNYRFDLVEAPQVIWHSLKLTNTHNQPWTTAPAMVMKDNRVLGQDTLGYTSPNSETNLKITQALDIQAEVNEYETARQRGALQHQRRNYDLVTVKGTIAITNYKSEEVTLEISKLLSGEVSNADGDPSINKLAEGLRSINSTSQIQWNIDIQPGLDNKITLEYNYQVYVQG